MEMNTVEWAVLHPLQLGYLVLFIFNSMKYPVLWAGIYSSDKSKYTTFL